MPRGHSAELGRTPTYREGDGIKLGTLSKGGRELGPGRGSQPEVLTVLCFTQVSALPPTSPTPPPSYPGTGGLGPRPVQSVFFAETPSLSHKPPSVCTD